jgi:hypothetical protein
MLGQIRGTAGLARLARMTTSEARQLAMALRRAADRGLGEAVSVHSTSCKAMDARCHCSVVVLVPGARA